MENTENLQPVNQTMTDDNENKTFLLEISKWGKFLAIVGYIGIAFLTIVAIAVMIGFSVASVELDKGFPMGILGVIYLVIAIIYYFPVNFLYKFSIQMKKGLESDNKQSIASGFENLKSLFKFMGILTIVILSIYALLLVIALPVTMLIAK